MLNLNPNKSLLLLAPMQGITTPLFRSELAKIGGMDAVATEFVRISQDNQALSPFERISNLPLQIQFMASNTNTLTNVVKRHIDLGLINSNDWIDLNAGCPSKRVNSRGAGAALLCNPENLLKMLEALRDIWSGVLSVKIRLGFNSTDEFNELLSILKDAPLDFITIHAKTRAEAKDPTATTHNSYLTMAASTLPYPVIGNGDLWSAADALKLKNECGLTGVMFGRPAVANPYIFREYRALEEGKSLPSNNERRSNVINFMKELLNKFQETKIPIGAWKELSHYFAENPLIGKNFFDTTKRLTTYNECSNVVDSLSHRLGAT